MIRVLQKPREIETGSFSMIRSMTDLSR